jgi:hypothetical protein
MKYYFLPFLGFMLMILASCESGHPTVNIESINNPNSMQAIISIPDSNYVIIQNNEHPVTLSDEELKEVDTLLNLCINDFNAKGEKKRIDLSHYMLQYMPSMNSKGEKEVHIEGLCSSFGEDWKTFNSATVMDGGKCFFNLTINLHSKKYTELGMHSMA